MAWDETSLEQPNPLIARPSSRLTKFEGTCEYCNNKLGLDQIAISMYEVQSKPRVQYLRPTEHVLATYSDTPVEGWMHLACMYTIFVRQLEKHNPGVKGAS